MNAIRILVTTAAVLSPAGTRAASVNANFISATAVPVTAASYTASGNEVAITLGFAVPTGTHLTLINNTGRAFISGQFSNLAHGAEVNLTYDGTTYPFVANYFGGSGNDLVLQWASRAPTAWGTNANGELGNGSLLPSNVPTPLDTSGTLAGKTVIAVAAGAAHCLAACADGSVAAWGSNTNGQLGDGSSISSNVPVTMTAIGALAGKTVVAVAAGGSHSVALCADGTVAAWGANANGQLGNNSTTASCVPVAVIFTGKLAGKQAVAVAAGTAHSLALCADGTVAAWGKNTYGQVGNGGLIDSKIPVAVSTTGVLAGQSVVAIAAGNFHSLALCAEGCVTAWGYNASGQLGNNSTTRSSVPVAVSQAGILSGRTVTAIAAGGSHSLAICADGGLAAWGYNFYGQLGNQSVLNSSVPVAVTNCGPLVGKSVVAVATGQNHCLARCDDGSVAGWGANGNGQLGDGHIAERSLPVAVSTSGVLAGKPVTMIAASQAQSVALAALPLAAAPGPYTEWLRESLTETELTDPAIAAATAIPAGDGITNLIKYALDLAPLADGSPGLPFAGEAEGYLTLTYRRHKHATDLTYTVEAGDSPAAGSWVPVTHLLAQSDEGDHWLITIRDQVPIAVAPRRFMRLKVNR